MTQKANQNPWTMDVRVRERNLRSGALTEKDLEKYLSSLPDLAEQVEPFATPQPALAQPPAPQPAPTDGVEEHVAVVAEQPVAAPPPAPAPVAAPAPAPAPPVVEAAPPAAEVAPAPANIVVNGEGEPT